jgi:hypothetical protein
MEDMPRENLKRVSRKPARGNNNRENKNAKIKGAKSVSPMIAMYTIQIKDMRTCANRV